MKKLNWEVIGTMILIAIFWLALIFLLGSCTPIDQNREDRQDSSLYKFGLYEKYCDKADSIIKILKNIEDSIININN